MVKLEFGVKRSEGSDGYTCGTWLGWVKCAEHDGVSYESNDGGHPTKDSAVDWARNRAAAYCQAAYVGGR